MAKILDIDERTIDRYLNSNNQELKENCYKVLTCNDLKQLCSDVNDKNVVNINSKSPSLGIFSFRTVLNLAMLVTESEKAKLIRSRILDIVIGVMAQNSGGHTKYINQRDCDYLPSVMGEESYWNKFTGALKNYLEMGNHKYAVYTDKIYKAIFLENAREYEKILKLVSTDNIRDTMYSEVLKSISSFENA